MGIRIHKNIGYFLSLDKANEIFVDNYLDVLENLDYSEDNQEELFFNNLEEKIQHLNGSRDIFSIVQLKDIIKSFRDNKLKATDLIESVYFYDDLIGFIFKTPDMVKVTRNDDLIDYYDHIEQTNQLKLLHQPIYPISGFTYLGGLEAYDIYPQLNHGETYSENLGTIAYELNKLVYHDSFDMDIISSTSTILTTNNYFHPKIDAIIYMLVTTACLLKDHISNFDFDIQIEPAIIETWS